MIRIKDYPKYIIDSFTAFEALRRLGFKPEDLWFRVGAETLGQRSIYVSILQGGREFNIETGRTYDPEEKIRSFWKTLAQAIVISEEPDLTELNEVWQKCEIRSQGQELVATLIVKGFKVPGLEN